MRNFNHNRSDNYQALLVEIPFSSDMIAEISNHRELFEGAEHSQDTERKMDLIEELKVEFWRVVEKLTERQKQVLKLHFKEEKTQTEVAKILGVNQSSVTKSINGNCDYKKKDINNRKSRKVYGGAKKKLKKLTENDEKIQEILRQISEIE